MSGYETREYGCLTTEYEIREYGYHGYETREYGCLSMRLGSMDVMGTRLVSMGVRVQD